MWNARKEKKRALPSVVAQCATLSYRREKESADCDSEELERVTQEHVVVYRVFEKCAVFVGRKKNLALD